MGHDKQLRYRQHRQASGFRIPSRRPVLSRVGHPAMANQHFNYNCPVQNRYSDGGLSEEEEMLTDNTHHQPVSKVNKSIIDKPPPLIVKMTTAPILKQLIASVTKVFNLKFMANAVKIYTATEEDFHKLKKILIEKTLLMYTHRTKTEKIEAKMDKFVLFGLDSNITPEQIKEELKE